MGGAIIPPEDLTALLSPSVATLIANMNISGANGNVEVDLTCLSALAYVESGSKTFDPANIAAAVNMVNAGSMPNSKTGVNPLLVATAGAPAESSDVIYTALAPLVSAGVLPQGDAAIANYVYLAGKAGYVALLVDDIGRMNGSPPGTITGNTPMANTTDPRRGGVMTLNTLIDLVHDEMLAAVILVDVSGGMGAAIDLPAFIAAAGEVLARTIQATVPSDDLRNFMFNKNQHDAMLKLALGPWLTLLYMLSLVASPKSTFVDQIYARYAFMQAVRIALTKLSNAYAADYPAFHTTNGQVTVLTRWLTNVLPGMLPTLTTNDFQASIQEVSEGAKAANKQSKTLAAKNRELAVRLALTNNLEVSKEAQTTDVTAKRRAFYAWVVAYVVIVAASSFLIVTDRLSAFMALAVGTLSAIALVLIGGWVWRKLVRRGLMSPT